MIFLFVSEICGFCNFRSGLSEISSNKAMPAATATSRVSKVTRTGSTKTDPNPPSTLQRRNSVDSKPARERRGPKTSVTTPEVSEVISATQLLLNLCVNTDSVSVCLLLFGL